MFFPNRVQTASSLHQVKFPPDIHQDEVALFSVDILQQIPKKPPSRDIKLNQIAVDSRREQANHRSVTVSGADCSDFHRQPIGAIPAVDRRDNSSGCALEVSSSSALFTLQTMGTRYSLTCVRIRMDVDTTETQMRRLPTLTQPCSFGVTPMCIGTGIVMLVSAGCLGNTRGRALLSRCIKRID